MDADVTVALLDDGTVVVVEAEVGEGRREVPAGYVM